MIKRLFFFIIKKSQDYFKENDYPVKRKRGWGRGGVLCGFDFMSSVQIIMGVMYTA